MREIKASLYRVEGVEGEQMKVTEIKAGKFYVKEALKLVCEIIQEKGHEVYWQGYDLGSGKPIWGVFLASKQKVIRWADREATAEEIAKLRLEDTRQQDMEE